MACILHLETASKNCSVAVSAQGSLLAKESLITAQYSHSENLHPFIADVLRSSGKQPENLDAIAVSMGPGSYTGLRIGVAAAKGFCFALDLPLIALNTLDIMMQGLPNTIQSDYFAPMLDARRMEVYTRIYNTQREAATETQAEILTTESFSTYITPKKLTVFGEGAAKFKTLNPPTDIVFLDDYLYPDAQAMIALAEREFKAEHFESLAYFEPFYLKDFVTTLPKKRL